MRRCAHGPTIHPHPLTPKATVPTVIQLSRLHGNGSIVINADLIETMEACPDTTITLMTKRKFVVAETLEEVIARVVEFRRRVHADLEASDPAQVGHALQHGPGTGSGAGNLETAA
jgi:flagellar protein FlbD